MTAPAPLIDRGFVRIEEGLVHYRRLDGDAGRPLYMIHLSPSSSRNLEPLMGQLRQAGVTAPMIAPDTLGNGDSAAPAPDNPDIAYFAGSVVRVLDALWVDRVDLYGTHTGARTACEVAAAYPDRVGRVVMDGIREYSADDLSEFDERYAPRKTFDDYGSQLNWAFNFMRDQHLHYPYFKRDKAHRLSRDVPSAEALHWSALDLAKSLTTYHKPYMAAFTYPTRARMAEVRAPALLLKPEHAAATINAAADELAALAHDGRAVSVNGHEAYARAIAAFLSD